MICSRGAKKREAEDTPDPNAGGSQAKKKLKTSKHVAKAVKKSGTISVDVSKGKQKKKAPKGLLDMPAGRFSTSIKSTSPLQTILDGTMHNSDVTGCRMKLR